MRDLRKDMDKLEQKATALDDASQTMQDQLQQTTDSTEKQLQELMNVANEWLTSYERIMGHGKKTKKAAR
jgi:ribosome recycling factor